MFCRILFLITLLVLTPLSHAEGVVDLSSNAEVPSSVSDIVVLLTGPGSMILWGLLFIVMIYRAWKHQDYDGAIILGALVFIGIFVRAALFNDGTASVNGWFTVAETTRDAAHSTGYVFPVYGSDPSIDAHFRGETASYEMIRGWAMAGSIIFFRILDWGFSTYVIQTVLFFGFLMKLWQARIDRNIASVVMYGSWLFLGGWLLLWPSVELQNNLADNPVLTAAEGVYEKDTSSGGYIDQPRITKIQAMTFSFMTDITESLGARLSYQSKDGTERVLSAALEAKLDDSSYQLYMDYATQCFTAVQNARTVYEIPNLPPQGLKEIIERSIGTPTYEGRGGFVANFLAAPRHVRHALSPVSDAMLRGIMPSHMVPYSYDDNGYTGNFSGWSINRKNLKLYRMAVEYFDGMYYPKGMPNEFDPHPSILSGYGKVKRSIGEQFFKEGEYSAIRHIDGAANGMSLQNTVLRGETVGDWQDKQILLLPLCSGYDEVRVDLDGSAWIATDISNQHLLRFMDSQRLSTGEISKFRAIDLGDYVRVKIASNYFDEGGAELCKEVSATGLSQHSWGCLVAGAYRPATFTPTNMHERSMQELQDVFDTRYLPTMVQYWKDIANSLPDGEYRGRAYDATNWNNHTGIPASGYLDDRRRTFIDMYFTSPNIVGQLGLLEDAELGGGPEDLDLSNGVSGWLWDLFTSIGGFVEPTILGVFGWFASLIAKFIMMIYPHTLGLSIFFLMITYLPFAVFSLMPGKQFVFLEWVKAAVWVLTWPLFISFGLSLINHGASFGMASLALRAENGPGMTEPVLKLFGAMFIFGAGSMSSAFLSLSMSGLAQGISTINQSAIKVVGLGAALTGVVTVFAAKAAIGAALLAKGAGGMGLMKGLGAVKGLSGISGGGGGGGSAKGLAGNSPKPSGGSPQNVSSGGSGQPGVRIRDIAVGSFRKAEKAGHIMQKGVDGSLVATGAITSIGGGEAGNFAQGAFIGRQVGTAADRTVTNATRWTASKTMLAWDKFRGESGSISGNIRSDDNAAREFATNATDFDRLSVMAGRLGQPKEQSAATHAAASSYSDQARLSSNGLSRMQASLKAFERFNEVGDSTRASEEAAFAQQQLARFTPRTDTEQAFAADARARLEIGKTRVLVQDGLPDAPQAVRSMQGHSEASIRLREEQIETRVRDRDNWHGDHGDFASVAHDSFQQMRIAVETDNVNRLAVERGVDGAQRSHLAEGVLEQFNAQHSRMGDMGNERRHLMLRSALEAGSGNTARAARQLESLGIHLSAEDMEQLQYEMNNGQTAMFERILRKG